MNQTSGRPTKGTVDARGRLLTALTGGATLRAACEYAGFSEDSLARYRAADAAFAERIKKAQAGAYMRNLAIIQKAARKTWQAAAWWLERKFPDEWARRDRMEHAGPGGGPIPMRLDLSRLTDEELAAFRAMLAKLEGKA